MQDEDTYTMATDVHGTRDGGDGIDYPEGGFGRTEIRRRAPLILLAEDDYEMRSLLAVALRTYGYHVDEFDDGARLREYLDVVERAGRLSDVDLIISDVRMPGASGLDLLVRIASRIHRIPFIVITAFGDDCTHATARALGAAAVFDKPFDIEDLETEVNRLVPRPGASRRSAMR